MHKKGTDKRGVRVYSYLTTSDYKRLVAACKKYRISQSSLIERALLRALPPAQISKKELRKMLHIDL